ncbi:MAG: phosphopantetheine-binding protein [Candidatus Jettenia sp.]|nr:MAG: phosphopantetheine-binding protein [Candidatus Jettenia sp.]
MYDTIQRLKELLVIRLKLKVGVDKIKDDTPLFGPNSLGLDSIDVLEMVIVIKKEFGVEIMDRETSENIFTSVGSIARYIEENR